MEKDKINMAQRLGESIYFTSAKDLYLEYVKNWEWKSIEKNVIEVTAFCIEKRMQSINERGSISPVIRKMQIKATRYHLTLLRRAKIQTLTANAVEEVERQEPLFIIHRNSKWHSHFGRKFGGFLENWT